jgi:RNA polymerase sigma-70 factor (ECF subfamily)
VAKRLTRARQRIRDQQIPFEIPAGEELTDRIDGVLKILYLLFNEGYKATSGDSLVRETLCYEAIRLAALLAGHRAGNQPRSHALLALMCLHAARLPERVDDNGNMLRLQDQNRDNWDKGLIARGIHELGQAASGRNVSEYHLQAGIAALHSTAADYKSTNWPSILKLYNQWIELDSSPVIALNRAVALAHVNGPQAGIDAVESMPNREQLDGYYLVYAVLGEFMWQLNQWRAAAEMFRQAIKLTTLGSEHAFLSNRLRDCEVCKTPDCMC